LGTPSIKRALKGDFDDQKQISSIEQHKLYSKEGETEPFTEEPFLPHVEDRPSIKAALTTLPKIQKDFSLLLEIDNRIQDEMLVEIRPELISYLRKELRNSNISLKTVITEIKREKIIYSDIERYQAMVGKNPDLALLKKTLNLDF